MHLVLPVGVSGDGFVLHEDNSLTKELMYGFNTLHPKFHFKIYEFSTALFFKHDIVKGHGEKTEALPAD